MSVTRGLDVCREPWHQVEVLFLFLYAVGTNAVGKEMPHGAHKNLGDGSMMAELALEATDFDARANAPSRHLGGYEAQWEHPDASVETLAEKFASRPGAVPS